MKDSRFLLTLSFVLALVVLLVSGAPVGASYSYSIPVTISNNSATSYTNIPVLVSMNNAQLYTLGYLDIDGLDTAFMEGSTEREFMVQTSRLGVFVPSLTSNQTRTYEYRLGDTVGQAVFPVIVGTGGNVTVSDNASLELGGNYTLEWIGFVDTSVNGTIVHKEDAFSLFSNGYGNITAKVYEGVNITANVTAVGVPTGEHTVRVWGDNISLNLYVNAGGSGTEGDPYIINDVNELQAMVTSNETWYELGNNIDASATSTWNHDGTRYTGFIPVGNSTSPFYGHLDGNGYTISNLYICTNETWHEDTGLFGRVGEGSGSPGTSMILTDIHLSSANVTALGTSGTLDDVGVLVGHSKSAVITNSSVTNSKVDGGPYGDNVGLLVGYFSGGSSDYLTGCWTTGTVTGSSASGNYGGLAGSLSSYGILVAYSWSSATVTGTGDIGGFAGVLAAPTYYCYATGDVTSTGNNTGGFAGKLLTRYAAFSYATGDVSSSGNSVGGFAGYIGDASAYYCWASGNVIGEDYVGGFVGNLYGDNIAYNIYIMQSFATGDVLANDAGGGFVGMMWAYDTDSASKVRVVNSYARGDVESTGIPVLGMGGFNGVNGILIVEDVYYGGTIENSYSASPPLEAVVDGFSGPQLFGGVAIDSFWDVTTSGQSSSSGGTGATTVVMKTKTTFTDEGWDFVHIWSIDSSINDGYPYLLGVGGGSSGGGGSGSGGGTPESEGGPPWYARDEPLGDDVIVPDNGNSWILMSSATPYTISYTHKVNDVLVAWYEPSAMISGDVLVDRQGADHNGIINWGSNSAGLEVSLGGMESPDDEEEESDIPVILPIPPAADYWEDEDTDLSGMPQYPAIHNTAVSLGWSDTVAYGILILIGAIVLGFAALIATGTILGFGMMFGFSIAAGSTTDAIPSWIGIVALLFLIFIGYIWVKGHV